MNWIGIGAVYPAIEPKVKCAGRQQFVFVCRVRARPELRLRFTATTTVISVNVTSDPIAGLLNCAIPEVSLKRVSSPGIGLE